MVDPESSRAKQTAAGPDCVERENGQSHFDDVYFAIRRSLLHDPEGLNPWAGENRAYFPLGQLREQYRISSWTSSNLPLDTDTIEYCVLQRAFCQNQLNSSFIRSRVCRIVGFSSGLHLQ